MEQVFGRVNIWRLLGLPAREFLSRYWPDRAAIFRGALARLAPVTGLYELQSVQSLMEVFDAPITCWGKHGSHLLNHQASWSAYLTCGCSLYFSRVERFVPALAEYAACIAIELGLPIESAYCNVFASPPGGGPTWHFDFDYGLNALLQGTKEWSFAPNTTFVNPTESANLYSAEQIPRSMWRTRKGDLPTLPNDETQTFVLHSGDVVFVPRGWWHRSVATDACIALDFAVCPPTNLDTVMALIYKVLYQDDGMRSSLLHSDMLGDGPSSVDTRLLDRALELLRESATVTRPGVDANFDYG